MATELRWALIVISALVIGGLLIHGLWSVRKKGSEKQSSEVSQEPKTQNSDKEPDEPEIGEMTFNAVDEEPVADGVLESGSEGNSAEADADERDLQDNEASDTVLEPQDFIILHVEMPEGLSMAGSKLLPTVLSLGFKYSDEGFFNRHLEPSGNGPVLFRLVNMFNPGTFDIDNMEQFNTGGISLFMTLPCEGDNLAAFNMLHSASKKLAEEFGATVLDKDRQPLTVEAVRGYVEKVREFAA
ncbi:cell division protein ZipA [Pseudoalteromonas peptidolytica]|uniref:cell division protein ZipA n=1 Tax=Pseudoalteromonas peptidolytica TaxID=61150 RepID=UPI00298D9242|nr:cell division protein ZipA [Pseudoalteromonas peptidolytica]MDW7547333.1 cell division protein ZipA [Pseudoalteromonas peptidolytica]